MWHGSTGIAWPIEVLNLFKTIFGQICHFSFIPIERIQILSSWLWTKFYCILLALYNRNQNWNIHYRTINKATLIKSGFRCKLPIFFSSRNTTPRGKNHLNSGDNHFNSCHIQEVWICWKICLFLTCQIEWSVIVNFMCKTIWASTTIQLHFTKLYVF